jgi:hypothetical protein
MKKRPTALKLQPRRLEPLIFVILYVCERDDMSDRQTQVPPSAQQVMNSCWLLPFIGHRHVATYRFMFWCGALSDLSKNFLD